MWKVEGVDCLAMYCVKDVNVNDVITFDHSAEIEVRSDALYHLKLSRISFTFSILVQAKDVRADPTTARRYWADRRTQEVLSSAEHVKCPY